MYSELGDISFNGEVCGVRNDIDIGGGNVNVDDGDGIDNDDNGIDDDDVGIGDDGAEKGIILLISSTAIFVGICGLFSNLDILLLTLLCFL